MPNKGIRNAVYKRAGGKGQSSKFYNIYGKVVKPTDPTGFKGGQGWTATPRAARGSPRKRWRRGGRRAPARKA